MNKIVTCIKHWLARKAAERKQRIMAARENCIIAECESELQVMEWNMDLYICYKGIPLINQELLQGTPQSVLCSGRLDLKKWKEAHDEYGKKSN